MSISHVDAGEVSTPDTIVLIHGLWMTPRSWERWIERYKGRGYTVVAPSWPVSGTWAAVSLRTSVVLMLSSFEELRLTSARSRDSLFIAPVYPWFASRAAKTSDPRARSTADRETIWPYPEPSGARDEQQ